MFKLRRLSDRMVFYVLFILFYVVGYTLCTLHIPTTIRDNICLITLVIIQIICIILQIRSYKLRILFDIMIEQAYSQASIILPYDIAADQIEKLKENIRQDKNFSKIMRGMIW